MNFKKVKKMLTIPKDVDAKGIVVRTLDHKYYLRPWTLRFIDPYINVEFQTYMRRIQLERLRFVCVLMLMVPFYIGVISRASHLVDDFITQQNTRVNVNYALKIFAISYVCVSLTIFCAVHSRFAYVFNLNALTVIFLVAILTVQTVVLSYTFDIKTPDRADGAERNVNTMMQFGSAYKLLYRAFPLGTTVLCIYVCVCSILILDIIAWYVVVGACTLILVFILYESYIICGHDFRLIHEYFDVGISVRFMIQTLLNIPFDTLIYENKQKHMPTAERYIMQQLSDYYSNSQNYTFKDHPLYQVLNLGRVTPYRSSVFDLATYNMEMTLQCVSVWPMFVVLLTYVVYQHNLSMRTIFILTRVRSNKDAPRKLDCGIRLRELTDVHITNEDQRVAANNLIENKKSSTNTDSSGNEILNERMRELENLTSLEDLNEMAERLSEIGTNNECDTCRVSIVSEDKHDGSVKNTVSSIVLPRAHQYTQSIASESIAEEG